MLNGAVKTEGGLVEGVAGKNLDVVIFKGIPYAAPPIGEYRWKAPQPAIPWEDVRKCNEFGNISMQQGHILGSFFHKEFYTEEMPMSEDCLYLNIWTPAKTNEDKLPVMLWIHGGGFGGGYGHEIEFDGEGFAKKGVILVTINYRTGILGFLAHPELNAESEHSVSGNYGILDQITALTWIKNNINAFGGDPGNITIFGQSAGAMSVEILISTTLTKGIVSKAIMQSGGGIEAIKNNLSLETAQKIGTEVCSALKADSINDLRQMSADQLIKKTSGFKPQTACADGPLIFTPNVDGYVLLDKTSNLINAGKHHDIPYIVGYNWGETSYFRDMMPGVTAFAKKQAELGRSPAYVYCFDRELPGDAAGSFHSGELWYVFETLSRCWRPFTEVDQRLSAVMSEFWANFARNSDPNAPGLPLWSQFTNDFHYMMKLGSEIKTIDIDEDLSAIVNNDPSNEIWK